jgi:hypothetical protein
MYQKIMLVSALICLPLFTSSSFVDVYSTRAERLLGNPTKAYEYLESLESYDKKTNIALQVASPEMKGKATLQADMYIDALNNRAWKVLIDAESETHLSWAIALEVDLVATGNTLYIKPSINQLPAQVPVEDQVGLEFIAGKRLQIGHSEDLPLLAAAGDSPLLFSKQLTSLATKTPLFTSTKETKRNGYEIYILDINPAGVQQLMYGIEETVSGHLRDRFYPALRDSTVLPDLDMMGIKTVGVIGKKGDEIKMGMIMKKVDDPNQVVLTSVSTETTANVILRMLERRTKKSVFTFSVQNDSPRAGSTKTQVKFGSEEDALDIQADIAIDITKSQEKAITTPQDALPLDELIKGISF